MFKVLGVEGPMLRVHGFGSEVWLSTKSPVFFIGECLNVFVGVNKSEKLRLNLSGS